MYRLIIIFLNFFQYRVQASRELMLLIFDITDELIKRGNVVEQDVKFYQESITRFLENPCVCQFLLDYAKRKGQDELDGTSQHILTVFFDALERNNPNLLQEDLNSLEINRTLDFFYVKEKMLKVGHSANTLSQASAASPPLPIQSLIAEPPVQEDDNSDHKNVIQGHVTVLL